MKVVSAVQCDGERYQTRLDDGSPVVAMARALPVLGDHKLAGRCMQLFRRATKSRGGHAVELPGNSIPLGAVRGLRAAWGAGITCGSEVVWATARAEAAPGRPGRRRGASGEARAGGESPGKPPPARRGRGAAAPRAEKNDPHILTSGRNPGPWGCAAAPPGPAGRARGPAGARSARRWLPPGARASQRISLSLNLSRRPPSCREGLLRDGDILRETGPCCPAARFRPDALGPSGPRAATPLYSLT